MLLLRHIILLALCYQTACAAVVTPKITSYVINLDRAPDRLAYVMPQVTALGYPTERLAAVDGTMLSTARIEQVLAPHFYYYTGHYADLGTIGCSLSHIAVWQMLVASDADYALVFEDDVSFSPTVLKEVIQAMLATQKVWDLVNFQAAHRGFPVSTQPLGKNHSAVHYLTKITNAGCYLLHRNAAQKLLHHAFPLQMPVDHYFMRGWELGIQVTGVEPRLVHQKYGNSQIQTSLKRYVAFQNERPNIATIVGHELYKIHSYISWFSFNFYHHFFPLHA